MEASANTGKGPSFGSLVRRRLSDITNYLPQHKSSLVSEKPPLDSSSAREQIENLLKEKNAMINLIQEKNKIIELCGVDIQNMVASIQKLKLQNWSLAQANSHISAELHLNREKLKAMQHEIECTEALFKAKNLQDYREESYKISELKDVDQATNDCVISANTRCSFHRSRSTGSRPTSESDQRAEREVLLTKRRCLRRKSANFLSRSDDQEDTMLEMDAKYHPEIASTGGSRLWERRISISRPLRKAAEKVESYKEKPLNTKMRRE